MGAKGSFQPLPRTAWTQADNLRIEAVFEPEQIAQPKPLPWYYGQGANLTIVAIVLSLFGIWIASLM